MGLSTKSTIVTAFIACIFVTAMGCSGGGGGSEGEGLTPSPGTPTATVVSGTVMAPGSAIAFFKQPSFWDLFESEAYAGLAGLASVPDGTIVQLARLDTDASSFGIIATTTTSRGRYSFNLTALGLQPASDLIVRVAGPSGKEMRAFVIGTTVDINPAAEAAYQLSVQALAGAPINNLTLQEVADISGSISTIVLLQNIGNASSVDQAVNLVKAVVAANSAITNYISGAIGSGQTAEGIGDIGNYLPLSQGNSWTYKGTKTETGQPTLSYANTESVNGTRVVGSVTALVITTTNSDGDGTARDEYVSKEAADLRILGNSDSTDTLSPLIVPYSTLHFPIHSGSTYRQLDKTGLLVDLDSDGSKETITIKSSVSVLGFETLSVPAGTFSNTAKVVTTTTISASNTGRLLTATQTDTLWLAPGIGIIKSQTIGDFRGVRISTTEELSSYTVDGTFEGGVPGVVMNTGSFANTLAFPGKPASSTDGSNYLVVTCSRTASTPGLTGVLVSPTGDVGTPFVIEPGECGSTIDTPDAAFDGTNYLVTYAHRSRIGDDNRIRAKRVSKAGSVLDNSPGVLISLDTPVHRGNARVSSDGTNYLVVWWEFGSSSEVFGARISPTGQNLGIFQITVSMPGSQSNPKVAFDGSNYLVIWEHSTSANYQDLHGARISPAGVVLDGGGVPIATTLFDDTRAELAFDGTNYLVVWESIEPHGTFANYQIRGMRLTKSASLLDGPSSGGGILITLGNLTGVDVHFPSIIFDGANYRVAWQSNSNAKSRIFGTKVSRGGQVAAPSPNPQGFPLGEEPPPMTLYQLPTLTTNSSGVLLVWVSVHESTKLSHILGTNVLP